MEVPRLLSLLRHHQGLVSSLLGALGWSAKAKEPTYGRVVVTSQIAGARGGEFLSEEELGATKERDFAPEGRRFFKILGRRLIVTWKSHEIANSPYC